MPARDINVTAMWLVQEQERRVNIPGMVPFSVEGERSELKKTKTSSDCITQFAIKEGKGSWDISDKTDPGQKHQIEPYQEHRVVT